MKMQGKDIHKKGIVNISFNTLFSLSKETNRHNVYNNECLVINPGEIPEYDLFKYPFRIDSFVLAICTKGNFELTCDQQQYLIASNTILVYTPGKIVEVDISNVGEFFIILLKPEFLSRLNIDIKHIALNYQQIQDAFFIQLSPKDYSTITDTFTIAAEAIKGNKMNPFYHHVITSILETLMYKCLYLIMQDYKTHANPNKKEGRELFHFEKFMRLLSIHYQEHHDIQYYASLMNVTPKYLSLLIKRSSGKLASQWINEYLISEAKKLIKYSDMSIQEIAYKLHFANQSSFGKFFKKHTGISPNEYRKRDSLPII